MACKRRRQAHVRREGLQSTVPRTCRQGYDHGGPLGAPPAVRPTNVLSMLVCEQADHSACLQHDTASNAPRVHAHIPHPLISSRNGSEHLKRLPQSISKSDRAALMYGCTASIAGANIS